LPPDSKEARILIVDDEEDITSILKKGLEKYGYEIDVFNDPLLALSSFRAGSYDLILLDIRMPKMDGFELYQRITQLDSKTKVCFMTAFEVYYDALKELFPDSYESICFIRKPIAIQDFVKRISKEMHGS
jgi:two-component system catabolic regulation response regulator CreB/two-component system response regulator ChvI